MLLLLTSVATISLFLSVVEICKANFRLYAFYYEQTSPLAVYTYSFGYPFGVQFVRSEHFFLFLIAIKKRGGVTTLFYTTFCDFFMKGMNTK